MCCTWFLGGLELLILAADVAYRLGWVTNDLLQGWGMILVLGVGIPLAIAAVAAVGLSLAGARRDPALLLPGLLLPGQVLAAFLFDEGGLIVIIAYVLASLGLGMAWLVAEMKRAPGPAAPSNG